MIHQSLTSGPLYLLFALAFALFMIVPGALAAGLLFGRRLRDPVVRAPLSFGFGVALMSFFCLAVYLAGAGARAAMVLSIAGTVLLAAANLFAWRRRDRGAGRASGATVGGPVRWVLLGLVVVVYLLVVSRGAVFSWQTDSLDHVGTVREIVETDEVFPANAFYAGDEGLGADPRKGLFHTALAVVSIATGIEPYKVWIWLPSLVFPLLLLAFFTFCREVFRNDRTALVGALLFVLCVEGINRYVIRAAGFPAQIAWLQYLLALTLMFRYVRLADPRYLVGAVVLGAATGTVHIYYFFQFGIALCVWLLFALALRRHDRALLAGIVKTGAVSAVLSIPFLAVKYRLSYAVDNPFDEQLRWVMFLTDDLYVVNPVEPWNLVGPMALFAFFLTPFLWRRARRDPAFLFLFAAMLATPLIIYNPLLVPPLGEFLTTGLVRRIVFLAPYIAVVAFFTARTIERLAAGPGARARVVAVLILALVVVLLVPYAIRFQRGFSAERIDFERKHSAFVWYDALEYLEANVREAGVVLSDPWTSYSVPAFTRHYVVAVPVGHASPKDARNVYRVRDAMTVLNPYAGIDTTRSLLDRYRVDYVVLNATYTEPVVEFGWSLEPRASDLRRAKFESHPGLFRSVYDSGGVVIYAYDPAGDASGAEPPDLPFVLDTPPALGRRVDAVFEDQFLLLGAETDRDTVARGALFRITCYWRRAGTETIPSYYRSFTRFDTDYPKNALYNPRWSKVYRYARQKLAGERYRFRHDHNPRGGVYPPYRWTTGEVVADEYVVRVPPDVAVGNYDVEVKLRAMPFSPNYHLRDFLRDDDVYAGVKVGSIEITR